MKDDSLNPSPVRDDGAAGVENLEVRLIGPSGLCRSLALCNETLSDEPPQNGPHVGDREVDGAGDEGGGGYGLPIEMRQSLLFPLFWVIKEIAVAVTLVKLTLKLRRLRREVRALRLALAQENGKMAAIGLKLVDLRQQAIDSGVLDFARSNVRENASDVVDHGGNGPGTVRSSQDGKGDA